MHTTPTTTAETGASRTQDYLRFGILAILAALTVAVFVAYVSLATGWRSLPFPGVMLNYNFTVSAGQPSGSTAWPGLEAGLRPGDRILSINDQMVYQTGDSYAAASQAYQDILRGLSTGDEVTVTFSRPVGEAEPAPGVDCQPPQDSITLCATTYTLDALPPGDFLALFVTPFVSGLVVLLVALGMLALRPRDPAIFPAVVIGLLLAIFMGGIFDASSSQRLLPLWLMSGILLGGVAITFGLVFPAAIPAIRKNTLLCSLPVVVSALLAVWVIAAYTGIGPAIPGRSDHLNGISALTGMAILAALLFFYHRPNATSALMRDQANAIFIGVMLAMAPAGLWLLAQVLRGLTGQILLPFSIEATMPFFILPAVSIAYAVLQYRRINTDQVISQAITYSLMLLALMVGYFLLVLGASLLTTDVIDANNPLLIVITIFFVSLLFVPLRTTLQRRIDRIYFRTRHNYQNRLEEFGAQVASLAGQDVMIREFRALLDETISPLRTLIFLYEPSSGSYVAYGEDQPESDVIFEADSGIVELLNNTDASIYLPPDQPWPPELHADRTRLSILRVIVIAGMAGSERLNGFVCIGPPRSGANSYDFEQLRFINSLVGQLAIAVERTQVISSLERRVRELDVLSQVGQAVNFTIEFDDLLELISAQTLKLFQSPFFYIVLYEAITHQLYYAFFLEYDERDQDRENQKWALGIDLYSEVIQSSQPRLVDDYTRTLALKGYEIHLENPETKAWMGVPLIAGSQTLGVLAVGEADPTRKYTPQQLRIFSDIGALAATSLEKAQLFSQANIRARQLTVLNDISRQLVATEGDIEKLLELITSSAVDILNAEAGSLLLTVDDGKGLEFRAAVGGTGHELIGKYLPAGHGLVGEVAQSGAPLIVNDTASDPRWDGEIVKDGFHTKSVLAVPLIAKGTVIGVLEVINKLDGSVYVEDDVALLTSFAGQAAIAFENARLYQQTDQQLTRRVQELEALERIDVELNRTLDLDNVAEITIRWAIANSSATAGLLGMINEERTHLQVVARSGYTEDDAPEGADGALWPLDQGIVKRVLRTRRPDLQPDVTIDPDFVPSLRDSLSQITVPIFSGDEINALLVLETDREPRLNLLDLDWVQRLAEHASIAIANAQLYSELTRANESKSEFVGFAAHELKNPLSSVKGYADLLKAGMIGDINDQQRDFLTIIRTNADRMQTIIDDLRDIARIDAQQLNIALNPVDFRNVLTETLRPFQQILADKGQALINNVPEKLPLVMGDQTRLIQVLTNLVSNANKYSPPEATITIDAEVREDHRDEDGNRVGPVLLVSVTDTGIGMQEEDIKKLFRVRYFRSDNEATQQQPGTGLGMMITQNIIAQHHGQIWVKSVLGEGSTFYFTVPLAPQEERQTEPASD
jgi:signal transduction histidine kinase